MIQSVGERDFGAQEVAHLLLSLPLYQCSYNFVTLSLDGGQLVTTDEKSSSVLNPSMLDVYSYRNRFSSSFSNIRTLNLLQFAATYSLKNNEPITRSAPVIVKTFPNYSADPKGPPKYGMYCKYNHIN